MAELDAVPIAQLTGLREGEAKQGNEDAFSVMTRHPRREQKVVSIEIET